jgi:DNA-binding transcriptional LysR family regulator
MNIKDLDLNLLTVFHKIYEARSISSAADQLDMSQPGISHSLKRLRVQLDDKLFVRKGNGVEPTVYASSIAEPIRRAIEFLEISLDPQPQFDPKTSTHHFRLMIMDWTEDLLIPSLVRQTLGNSNVTFELISPRTKPIEDAILDGSADLVLHMQPEMMHEIVCKPVLGPQLAMIFDKDHPISHDPNPVAAYQNSRKATINLTAGAVTNFDKVFVSQDGGPDFNVLMHSVRSSPGIVLGTDLICVVPRLYADHVAPLYGLGTLPLPASFLKQDFCLSWHRRQDQDQSMIWLRGVIIDRLAELSAGTSAPKP